MAMRSLASRSLPLRRSAMEGLRSSSRFFSDSKGGILSEEERAAENVYIQKMEREKLEKARLKAAKEKGEKEKSVKKPEDTHKG